MNSSKPIDISKSSLISLKAELSRKQAEVSSVKVNKIGNYVCPTINPNKKPLPAAKSKFCKNVEDNAEDKSSSVAEENSKALEHSRNVLEIKSKLYDELKQGRLVTEKGRGAEYLVDFTQKTSEKCDNASDKEKDDDQKNNVSEDDEYDRPSDPEEDWVDYTDIVGRQRRCLRRDLDAMRARDADSLLPPPPSSPPPPAGFLDEDSDASAAQRTSRELQAPAAPHIEAMRRQWRKQEEKLLEKDSVHYEDLLFNEARTHGVGYYAFSTDETERAREMRELERRRQETLQRQADAQGLRARRDAQLKARLSAAKARNRQRLGLPPKAEGEEDQKDDVVLVEKTDETKTEDDSGKKEELEAALKRAAHIRPWDAEKLGLKIVAGDQPAVMSQSEWVDMKREERISEFAPPQMYNQNRQNAINNHETEDLSIPLTSRSKSLFFTSKKENTSNKHETDNDISASLPCGSKSLFFTSKREKSSNKLETDTDISATPPSGSKSLFSSSKREKASNKLETYDDISDTPSSESKSLFSSSKREKSSNKMETDHDISADLPSGSKSLFFTSKRLKAADFFNQQQPQTSTEEHQEQSNSQYRTNQQSRNQYRNEELSRNQYRIHEQSKSSSQCYDRLADDYEEPVKRKRTEIPPPMTAEYFGGTGKPKHKQLQKSSGVGESISEGLKYLNEQKKVNNNKRDKGLLDIM
ncbi:coiled-coil domain-containing protein 174 [Nilaparvata lugens]|uniref:coiled-coil domain-containing protein 174 n=1 Tax=Nilaparvata lugens TaxID=108931 RepID=UPI00193E20EF|nr:coiled-coil domain-containing protein 174 [Nilaparvata lugens]XP_039288002.1 coiled-coil domain-containing protein 174 [Nilaparvata lugens]